MTPDIQATGDAAGVSRRERLPDRRARGRRWRRVLLLALLVIVAVVTFRARVSRKLADFEVYRTASIRALSGEPLYRSADGHWQFKYLPAFAFAVAPVAALPAPIARPAWFALSIACLVALLALSSRLLPDRRWPPALLIALTVIALGKFYAHELELGQTNILLTLAAVGALAAWRSGWDGAAGALFAAATVIKPYAVIFLPYLLLRRRWRTTAAFLVTLLVAVLAPAIRYGLQGNLVLIGGLWTTVTASTPPNLTVQDNISIAAMYAKWFGVGALASSLALLTLGALGVACVRVLARQPRAPRPEYLDVALLLMLIPLLSPQGWDYVLLLSTPSVMLLLNHLDRFGRPARWLLVACLAVVGLTLWDVIGRGAYRAFMVASVTTICALIEIAFLLRLRRSGIA
jgi:hypothetical protein